MSTVLRLRGFRVKIYSYEPPQERPHVHVEKSGGTAKIWLDNLTFAKIKGLSLQDEKLALELVRQNQVYLLECWREIHGR